jgi:adenine phosphoribosyltransferase
VADAPTAIPTERQLAALVADHLVDVPDWPKPGVTFKDISPLLAAPDAFRRVLDAMAEPFQGRVDVVAGIEARGFVLGAPLALVLGVGFVPIRKAGKLPGATLAQSYDLEYGSATVEVHADALEGGRRVLIVDDVLATGGTAAAARELVSRAGGVPVALAVLLELGFLHGRDLLQHLDVRAALSV